MVVASTEIEWPASAVWAAIADYSFDLHWRLDIVEMTPDPPTNATVFDVEPGTSYLFSGKGTTGIGCFARS